MTNSKPLRRMYKLGLFEMFRVKRGLGGYPFRGFILKNTTYMAAILAPEEEGKTPDDYFNEIANDIEAGVRKDKKILLDINGSHIDNDVIAGILNTMKIKFQGGDMIATKEDSHAYFVVDHSTPDCIVLNNGQQIGYDDVYHFKLDMLKREQGFVSTW